MPKFRRSPTNAKLPITCGGFVEIRRFLSFQIGGGWSAVPFLLPNNNAYCCTSTITANIMLNFDSGSLRLTAPRAAVTALYFFRLREFYTANPVFYQKYRLILAYISTVECRSQRRWMNRCTLNCGQLLHRRNRAEHICTADPIPAAINGRGCSKM